MITIKKHSLSLLCIFIISQLFVSGSSASNIIYKAPDVGTLLEYQLKTPGEKKSSYIYLEVIFQAQDFVVYKRTLSYSSEIGYFAEYKGFLIAPCGSKIDTLKNDVSAADALWPLKEGNISKSGSTTYQVIASTLSNEYFSEQQNIFKIEEKGKEGKIVYSFSPKFNVVMHLLWNDGSEEILTKISTLQGQEKKKALPQSCKQNIPQWFWK